MKAGWVPLWVRKSEQQGGGNTELIQRGGRWLPEEFPDWAPLHASHPSEVETELETGSPSLEEITKEPVVIRNSLDFYDLFVSHMELLTSDKPMKPAEIAQALSLRKVQVDDWLRRGVAEKRIEKLSRSDQRRSFIGTGKVTICCVLVMRQPLASGKRAYVRSVSSTIYLGASSLYCQLWGSRTVGALLLAVFKWHDR